MKEPINMSKKMVSLDKPEVVDVTKTFQKSTTTNSNIAIKTKETLTVKVKEETNNTPKDNEHAVKMRRKITKSAQDLQSIADCHHNKYMLRNHVDKHHYRFSDSFLTLCKNWGTYHDCSIHQYCCHSDDEE